MWLPSTNRSAINPAIPPSGPGCVDCLAIDGWWFHLRRCATCGHIGCCDSSPSQHAQGHAHGSGHSIVASYEPGEEWFWDYAIDWLGYRYRFVRRLVQPPPVLLVRDGQPLRRHLRSELLTMDELNEQMREQGIDDIRRVKRCFIESAGRMSVISYGPDERPPHVPEKRTF